MPSNHHIISHKRALREVYLTQSIDEQPFRRSPKYRAMISTNCEKSLISTEKNERSTRLGGHGTCLSSNSRASACIFCSLVSFLAKLGTTRRLWCLILSRTKHQNEKSIRGEEELIFRAKSRAKQARLSLRYRTWSNTVWDCAIIIRRGEWGQCTERRASHREILRSSLLPTKTSLALTASWSPKSYVQIGELFIALVLIFGFVFFFLLFSLLFFLWQINKLNWN